MYWNIGRRREGDFDILVIIIGGGAIVLGMLDDVGFSVFFGFVQSILPLLDGGSVAEDIQITLCQYRLRLQSIWVLECH